METLSPIAFFYRWAGYSYTAGSNPASQRAQRLNNARRLANAERCASRDGLSFDWAYDPDTTSEEFSDEQPSWSLWRCIVRDMEGKALASLWGIDFGRDGQPWGDPYRRVVEAELAREVFP